MCVETRFDELFEELKEELCGVIFLRQKKKFLEVEEIRKCIDYEFELDIRNDHFEESKEIKKKKN